MITHCHGSDSGLSCTGERTYPGAQRCLSALGKGSCLHFVRSGASLRNRNRSTVGSTVWNRTLTQTPWRCSTSEAVADKLPWKCSKLAFQIVLLRICITLGNTRLQISFAVSSIAASERERERQKLVSVSPQKACAMVLPSCSDAATICAKSPFLRRAVSRPRGLSG